MDLNVYLSTSTWPQASFHPGLEGHCAPAICLPSIAPNRCRGRERGRPAVVIMLLALAPCQSGEGGEVNQGSTHPHTESFSTPTGWEDGGTRPTLLSGQPDWRGDMD